MRYLLAIIAGLAAYLLINRALRSMNEEEERLARRLNDIAKMRHDTYQSERQEMLEQPLFDRTVRPMLEAMGNRMRSISGYFGRNTEGDEKVQNQLYQAGSTMSVSAYSALRLTITLIALALAVIIALASSMGILEKVLIIFVGAAGPYMIMRYLLTAQVTSRKNSIERQLPEVLDLLSVSVEAGLGFEQAIDYIIDHMEGSLIDELAITSKEISMGRNRRDAFILLGERCGADTVKSFTGALVQAMDMGISMKVLLRTQADSMRLHRKRVVEEQAMKLSTKLLFPLIFFIFPAIFIVLLGPALMNILQTL